VCTTRLATVVISIDNPGTGIYSLRNLLHVPAHRQASTDIKKLANARLSREEMHHPGQESPVIPGRTRRAGHGLDQLPRRFTIGREIILPAQQRVINTGHI